MPKVSVIIPVYNASGFLEKCCNSLFSQTLDDMQFIFVDDCSTDDSVLVIHDVLVGYPVRQNQVKIVCQPRNSGVAAARQRGLEESDGDFVIHCDADDWMEPDMYRGMYEAAVSENAEVVICDYRVCYNDAGKDFDVRIPDNCVESPSFNIGPIEGAVWNKLISRKLIVDNNVSFTNGIMLGEDFLFVTKCRILASKTIAIHKPYYRYCQYNQAAITRRYSKQKVDTLVTVARLMDEFIDAMGLQAEYRNRLDYLKFQAKQFLLIFKEIRDLKYFRSLFPEVGDKYRQMTVSSYVKCCTWLINHNMSWLASVILKCKDLVF